MLDKRKVNPLCEVYFSICVCADMSKKQVSNRRVCVAGKARTN